MPFLDLERRGKLPRGYRSGEERAQLALPARELDALVALLAGVVAHARRDGVIRLLQVLSIQGSTRAETFHALAADIMASSVT